MEGLTVKMLCLRTALVVSGLAFFLSSLVIAEEEPYCGLYSTHAAFHALGMEVDFDEMMKAKYLSGVVGSTARDLINLAGDFGCRARLRTQMNVAKLRATKSPTILHTSVVTKETGYHHWILFLGFEANGDLRVYDPPTGLYSMSPGELLTHWDGIGLTISRATDQHASAGIGDINTEVVLALALAFFAFQVNRIFPIRRLNTPCQILAYSMIAACLWHGLSSYGFLGNGEALKIVASRYDGYELGELGSEELEALLKLEPDSATIIDARGPAVFAASHIPTALNIPITTSYGNLRRAFESIPKSKHLSLIHI